MACKSSGAATGAGRASPSTMRSLVSGMRSSRVVGYCREVICVRQGPVAAGNSTRGAGGAQRGPPSVYNGARQPGFHPTFNTGESHEDPQHSGGGRPRPDERDRLREQLPERMEGDRRGATEGQAVRRADGRGQEIPRRRREAAQGRQALRVHGDAGQGEEDPEYLTGPASNKNPRHAAGIFLYSASGANRVAIGDPSPVTGHAATSFWPEDTARRT